MNWELGHARFLVVTFFLDIIIVSKLNSTNSAYKRQKNQTSNYQHLLDHRESKGILEKKKTISAPLTMLKILSVLITTSYGKYFKKWEYQTTLPVSREICMKVKNEQLDLDMEQMTGSKLGKELTKMYIPMMQNARLEESQARIKISIRNINNLRYADNTLKVKSEE